MFIFLAPQFLAPIFGIIPDLLQRISSRLKDQVEQ